MTKLKLGRIGDDKPVKLAVELPAAVHRNLIAYAEAIGRESGHPAPDPAKIVAPMIDTVEQAQVAIAAAKYPPAGNRSLGGSHHAINFDSSVSDYFRHANEEILVVLQTESPRGIANSESIYSLPGVDAIFVGPVDLRAQMRAADGTEATDAEFERALERVIATGAKCGTPTGMHVMEPEVALDRAAQGMQFIAIGSDLRFMNQRAAQVLDVVRPRSKRKTDVRY